MIGEPMGDFHARRIDVDTPAAARIYDYMLGGQHHYPVDEVFAGRILKLFPEVRLLARQNRTFLRDVVTFLSEQGIRQFIDIGSGIPTSPNVHEVARRINPDATVVYVDNSVEAVVTTREILEGDERAAVIEADIRDPRTILGHLDIARLIDFNQPVGLLIVSVLHFVVDRDRPYDLVHQYMDRLTPGSYLALSHATVDEAASIFREQFEAVERAYGDTSNPGTLRTRTEFTRFLSGLEIVGPDDAYAANWRSGEPVSADDPARCFYAAAGKKP
jgi:hypothetical protein